MLWINDKDAWTTWGVGLEDGSLEQLMSPPSMKTPVVNESRLEHGKRYINWYPRVDERSVSVSFHLVADSKASYLAKYASFLEELTSSNFITLRTAYEPDVCYRLIYNSTSQFRQFFGGIAKFSVKFIEPNPSDREIEE